MINTDQTNKIDKKYILISALAVFLSWVLHEFAHWAAGRYLGFDMGMSLNKTFPVKGQFDSDWQYQAVSAAGPVFTILEAFVFFLLLKQKKRKYFYPFLFTCFYMRFFAAAISVLNPNDEARISKSIGLGTFMLPVLVTVFLFFLIYKISEQYRFNLKFNIKTLGLTILFSSIIILTDQYFHIRLL